MITVKIGGSVVDSMHPSAISDIKSVLQKEKLVLVHGGGKEVTRVCEQLGKTPQFVTSPSRIKSRYTDRETMDIFTMVMSGRIGSTIVQMLQQNGINAVGLNGMDAMTIRAVRKKRLLIINERGRKQAIDGGYTGKISAVDTGLVQSLLDAGITPVISPIAAGEQYEFLNIDGDRTAAHVAGALGSDRVIFVTDVDGLLVDKKTVPSLTLAEARQIRPQIGPGMEKKILASIEALEMGVGEALIANGQKENPITSAISHDRCTVIHDD